MGLRTNTTRFVLRTTVRLAWAIERLSRSLGQLGERVERAVDAQALRRRVDITEVLEPLIAEPLG